jgi:hypothetical protein
MENKNLLRVDASDSQVKDRHFSRGHSKLEEYEDNLREKIWRLNVARDLSEIFTSLMKTLPIAIVVNVIALIITADVDSIRVAGTWVFTALLLLWLSSLVAYFLLALRLPRVQRFVEDGRRLVERHVNQTEDAFRDYKQSHVPPIADQYFVGSLLDDDGKVAQITRERTWRSKWAISADVQNDMAHWHGELVLDMDKLDVDAQVFYNLFDIFSERCSPEVKKWVSQLKDVSNPRYVSSVLAALYRFYIGDILNDRDTMRAQGASLIDSEGRTFLERHFFKGNPDDPMKISSLIKRADLKLLAMEARNAQKAAIAQSDRVLTKIMYEYSGGR